MKLNNLNHSDYPFDHWQFSDCLDKSALDEISFSQLPSGNRAYDGTRAADHTGDGLDGKLRLFVTEENCKSFPSLTKIIKSLQQKNLVNEISNLIKKDLSNSFVRLEIICDKKGLICRLQDSDYCNRITGKTGTGSGPRSSEVT